ncbi:hypothetical protein [Staphylococcus equorum]|uniref:hypothetical protein n=1 Tax=Staphylococcus equorum TaxID=246432 RepID=UPI00210EF6AF|nr:hypothetical protein [Staphylococcus equorum]MDK9849079.1 hypothetical protein [Staphylococcus equorum]
MKEIEMMTLTEFNFRMYAREYEQLKEEYDIYRLAFAIRDVKSEQKKKGGKKGESEYKFSGADDIVHYQQNIERLNKGEPVQMGEESEKDDNMPSLDVLKQIKNQHKSK